MILINKTFYFQSDLEIKVLIKTLKRMRKGKGSHWRSLPQGFGIHNGKPSIPDYKIGYSICKELRETRDNKKTR